MKKKYDKEMKKIEIFEKIIETLLVFMVTAIATFIATYQGKVEYKPEKWIFIMIFSTIITISYIIFKGIKKNNDNNN